ncbi:hypothetical protein FBY37_0431 [Streptomyces sp. SLBN-134]|nr:hypothetical protein FBY37_0431 [Streptomyces sp. SLBN-134]
MTGTTDGTDDPGSGRMNTLSRRATREVPA